MLPIKAAARTVANPTLSFPWSNPHRVRPPTFLLMSHLATFMDAPQADSSSPRARVCTRCRKRKVRCDGTRPSCAACITSKVPDQCFYDDSPVKTPTQQMLEHIEHLERRIRELEGSRTPSQSSSSSGHGSSGGSPAMSSAQTSQYGMPTASSASSPSLSPQLSASIIAPTTSLSLLQIFAAHRHQVGLDVNVASIQAAILSGDGSAPHPALLNAMYLWACFFSRPGPQAQQEGYFLKATTRALYEALQHDAHLADAIRASCLLALYSFCVGRISEGSYHQSAAATLVVRWELYRGPANSNNAGCFSLGQPRSALEDGMRISAFWQTYNLDRCWNAALGRATTIPADHTSSVVTDAPWPQPFEEYEQGCVEPANHYDTVKAFLGGQVPDIAGFSTTALRTKASALYAAAAQLAADFKANAGDLPLSTLAPSSIPDLALHQDVVMQFLQSLGPLQYNLAGLEPEPRHLLVVIRSLAFGSLAKISEPFVGSVAAHQLALGAAESMIDMLAQLTAEDYDFLDPILGPLWLSSATILFREAALAASGAAVVRHTQPLEYISLLLAGMRTLAQRFPIAVSYAVQVQNGLASFGSRPSSLY